MARFGGLVMAAIGAVEDVALDVFRVLRRAGDPILRAADEQRELGHVGRQSSSHTVGDDKRISRVLRGLVREGRLTPVSPKKYVVTPQKLVTRLDWTG